MHSQHKIWDNLNLEYPVRKFPSTGETSSTIGHQWMGQPEVSMSLGIPEDIEQFEYSRDRRIGANFNRSQTFIDFVRKQPETKRFSKHTSCTENRFIYPASKKLETRPLIATSHGTTEAKDKYTIPRIGSGLVTDKDQFKHPAFLPGNEITEPSWHKELPSLDTTYEGFEKYLDPYLTTSRLHHRPYTSEQLSRPTVTKDTVTYYTLANIPWLRSPKPVSDNHWLPLSRKSKPVYDREKFRHYTREIIVHNKPGWVPGSFRTENRENYKRSEATLGFRCIDVEDDIKSFYQHATANLQSNKIEEDLSILNNYTTENKHMCSGSPLCKAIPQFVYKNKRLNT